MFVQRLCKPSDNRCKFMGKFCKSCEGYIVINKILQSLVLKLGDPFDNGKTGDRDRNNRTSQE